jgi:hypothetical protein
MLYSSGCEEYYELRIKMCQTEPAVNYNLSFCLKVLREDYRNLSYNSWPAGPESNSGSIKYEVGGGGANYYAVNLMNCELD